MIEDPNYKCEICGTTKEVQESHDIPCYLFYDKGNRKARKQYADKLGRHLLCKKCHEEYEKMLNTEIICFSIKFAKEYFK